jgi:hypothetical protein
MNRLSKDETLVSVKMGKEYLDGVLVNILAAEADGLDPEKLRILNWCHRARLSTELPN